MIRLTMPYDRPPLRPNERVHWSVRSRTTREVRNAASVEARRQNVPPQPPSEVRIVWWAPDKRRRDASALAMFGKAAIDGLVDAGVWPDDHSGHVIRESHEVRLDRHNPRIELWIIPEPACFVCGSHDDRPTGCGPDCLPDHELADRYQREGDHQ